MYIINNKMAELTFRSRLQGTPYNLSSDLLEHQRLNGMATYQTTNQQEFDALRGTVGGSFLGARPTSRPLNTLPFQRFAPPLKGGSLTHRPMSQGQREEYVLRVKSEAVENPRTGKTERIDSRPMSGRSTEAIEKQRQQRVKQGEAIMKVNTRTRMKRSPELLNY
jgi:hypothetical protein